MTTPYENTLPIVPLDTSGLSADMQALVDGTKWGYGGYGVGVLMPYSFINESTSEWSSDYGGGEVAGAFGLTAAEQASVLAALNHIAHCANITFVGMQDNASQVGEMRFGSSWSIDSYAHAYVPYSDWVESGDVWFNGDGDNAWNPEGGAVAPGLYEWLTVIHEVGHALGLKHPFEAPVALPVATDNYFYTVMSYTAYAGAAQSVYADFNPTTLMYLDLEALQTLYGQSSVARSGNSNYVYQQGQDYWQCINDSGGTDSIRYEATSDDCRIDLSGNTFSQMGNTLTFTDTDTNTVVHTSRNTISIGPNVVIENATGGGGDDRLLGNDVANVLSGSAGKDTISGGLGGDTLSGGAGADRMTGEGGDDYYRVDAVRDAVIEGAGKGVDTVESSADFTLAANVEKLVLSGSGDVDGTGNNLANTLTGNAGANVLDGGGGPDTVRGLGGNDRLVWHGSDTLLDGGGGGADVLLVNGSGVTLDLTHVANTKIRNIEIVDIRGGGNNSLLLALNDVIDISGTSNTLRIMGDAGDVVDRGGGWAADGGADIKIGADFYETYTRGLATLLIDVDVTRIV